MATELNSWPRPHFMPGGGEPLLFYVVFGDVDSAATLPRLTYRSEGIAPGLQLSSYSGETHADVLDDFRQGYAWDELLGIDPVLGDAVERSPMCLILRGTPTVSRNLNYLRDTVGLLTFFLDHGGVAIYDLQIMEWWNPATWRSRVFEPAAPVPERHVVILYSAEAIPGRKWFHTRGMRKFGRPDISVHNVKPEHEAGVVDLCNRFIQLHAEGGVVPEGQEIRLASLPSGAVAHQRGDLDDPDFDNVHIETSWPDRG